MIGNDGSTTGESQVFEVDFTQPSETSRDPEPTMPRGSLSSEASVVRVHGFSADRLLWVFLGSFVLMVQTLVDCSDAEQTCSNELAFGLALSIISCVLSFLLSILERLGRTSRICKTLTILVLFLLWMFGAGFLTFRGPYVKPSNAYFAIWSSFSQSTVLLSREMQQFKNIFLQLKVYGPELSGLLVASVVALFAAINPCRTDCKQEQGWAVAASVVSTVFAVILIAFGGRLTQELNRAIIIFLIFWWLMGVGVCTFVGPFDETGNGYFAVWACLLASISLLMPRANRDAREDYQA